MTVSRALKNQPEISTASRQRICALAREMGYRPHPYVSALMSGVAKNRQARADVCLAVLHFETYQKTLPHAYYRGVCTRAADLGYIAEPFHYDPSTVSPARLRSILMARGIRGIILMPAIEGFTSIDFDFSGFATAALGHTIVNPRLPRIASDIYNGVFDGLTELIARGHSRIGLVNSEYVNRLARFLYSAAITAYRDHAATPGVHLVEHCLAAPIDSGASLEKLSRWIIAEKLDAVVCPLFGFDLHGILQNLGFSIPKDFSYLNLLDHPDPEVSQLNHMGELMGSKAVDVVTAMINRNEFQTPEYPQTVGTPSRWHEGTTTPDRRPLQV